MGESFRSGSQNSRIRGMDESYDEQIQACKTHIKFIEHLQLNIDVCISSYTTKFDDELLQIYKPYVVSSVFTQML
jgi:hypothetical protein